MKWLSTVVFCILLAVSATPVSAEEYNFTPGLWETTTTVEMEGLPSEMAQMMNVAPVTDQDCVTKNDFLFGAEDDDECTYETKRVSASQLTLSINCATPGGPTKGSGEINFNGKTASGYITMEIPQGPAGAMTMKTSFTSKYIGERH